MAIGLGLRLLLAWGPYGNYDQTSFEIVARIVESGGNVYHETSRYNYGPIWSLVLFALWKVHGVTGLSFHLCVRGFLSLVDVGNALLLDGIARRTPGAPRGAAALAYALNPVAILVVGFHGQFDNLAALPVLAALRLVVGPATPSLAAVWVLGTAGLCVKHLDVFVVLALFVVAGRTLPRIAALFASALAVFGATFLPFLPAGLDGIVRNVFLYRGVSHPFGLATVLPRGPLFVAFVVVLVAAPFLARGVLRAGPVETLELTAVSLLVFIPGIGEAYVVLPVIFGAVRRSAGWVLFSLVGYWFLLHGPNNLQSIPGPMPWGVLWLTLVVWLCLEVGRMVRRRFAGPDSIPA